MLTKISFILIFFGLIAGLLAGLLGIGGGTVLVPILIALGYQPVQSVGTSTLAIIMTSLVGSWQNWRMGYLDLKKVILLGIPSIITAPIGAEIADKIASHWLLFAFGLFLIVNIFLTNVRQYLVKISEEKEEQKPINPLIARIITGGSAGFLAGLFGIGGGVIIVPLQMLLLGEKIKTAIQTSLGVIVITTIAACLGHAYKGNVLLLEGIMLGVGGLIGVQVTTRFLPKLPDQIVSFCFHVFLGLLSAYIFWQSWLYYNKELTSSIIWT